MPSCAPTPPLGRPAFRLDVLAGVIPTIADLQAVPRPAQAAAPKRRKPSNTLCSRPRVDPWDPWDREAVKATTAAVKLLQRTDLERIRKGAEAAEWRHERDRLRKTAGGRAALGIRARTFIGPPTRLQWLAQQRQAERRADKAERVAQAGPVLSALPAPAATPSAPSEAEMAQRRAAALESAQRLLALMRAPARA